MSTFDRSNIQEEVISWYQDYWGGPVFPFTKVVKITEDTSLSTGHIQLLWEDAEDLLVEYFEKFQVEKRNFTFMKYFPGDPQSRLFDLFRKKENRRINIEPKPLTMKMLAESAKAGYWLYD